MIEKKDRKPLHTAMFSGGAASAYIAYRMVQQHGVKNSLLFFTDTQWEDEDNYRFMEEISDYIGIPITYVVDGRTPEDVFFDIGFLGNSRLAKCSEEIKVRQTLIFIEEKREEGFEPILYFGIGFHEKHRAENLTHFYEHFPIEPIEVRFPMIETFRQDIDAKHIIQNEWKIKLPRMYELGFEHANCAGRCVRGGYGHYALLYKVWSDRYAEQEDMENRFREKFKKDVSILKRDGKRFTLAEYRKMMDENGYDVLVSEKSADSENIPCVCSFS